MTKLGGVMALEELSNDELLARLRAHVGRGNAWLAGLLAYLGEMDGRRAYAEHACSSMWDFCVRRLGMSEGEALRRIAAARVIRRFPVAGEYVLRGELHLCAIYEMHKHLTADNHEELLREAAGKSTKVVAEMIAARFPKPDVHPYIEPLGPQPALLLAHPEMQPGGGGGTTTDMPRVQGGGVAPSPAARTRTASAAWPGLASGAQTRPRVEPLSATRYRVELTISSETKLTLERVRDLMLHRNPTGDLECIFDAALALLLVKLEKERLGKTARTRRRQPACEEAAVAGVHEAAASLVRGEGRGHEQDASAGTPTDASVHASEPTDASSAALSSESVALEETSLVMSQMGGSIAVSFVRAACANPSSAAEVEQVELRGDSVKMAKGSQNAKRRRRRHIPAATRREVFARDGAQCTFIDAEGKRCPARGYLELDHVEAEALGGPDTAANLRVRCRAHNLWHAAQVFGRAHVEERIDLRRRRRVAPCAPPFDAVARGLRSLGFREPEVRAAMAQLRTKLEPTTSAETILREALGILT